MSNMTNVGVQFTVTSNLSALTAEVNALNAKLAQHLALMSKMEDRSAFTQQLVASYKNAADASGLFNTQLVNLGTQVDQLGRRIERNQLKLSEYRRYIKQARQGIVGDVGELAKAQARMRSSMVLDAGDGKFMVATAKGIDMAAQKQQVLNEKIRIQNTLIRQSNESLINWGKNTQWAGRQLTVGLTIPMAIFGALASKVFRDADKELTRLQKVYGDGITKPTADEIKNIRSEVLELSKTISETRGGNLNEIISTGADIAATGKTGIELLKTLDETTRFQTLGEIDRQTAIKSTLALQTAFKQNTTELRNSINFLNAAENSTSLSMNDMAEAIPRAGTVVKGLGGNIEDLTLYMVAMREGGIDAAEGANALKSGLASIINPSTKAKKILAEYGIDIERIVETNKGQLTPTILALKEELDGLDGLARSRSITALFGKYQFARMSALFNNINSQGSQTQQILKLIGASAAELEDVAVREEKTITESLSKRWETAINRVKNAMIPIGETFTKIAIPLINLAAKILEVFNALPSALKTAAVALAAIAGIAGPIIMTMGIMANLVGQLKQGWRNLTGFGLKLMGRERQEMGPVLTPEMVAHDAALKKDSTAIVAHSEVLAAATAQLRSLGTSLIDNAVAPRFKGNDAPLFNSARYPTLTQTRVDSARTNEQMAVQLMGDSISGRPMVGGLLSSNPTGGGVGLVPAHYRWLESQDLKYAAAAVANLDSTMATQLLQIDEAVRRSKFGDGFAAYSHLYAEEGSTPLGSFIEWQKPNNARQGDVAPGELPANFTAGQRAAQARLLAGGGEALYAEAMNNPQLRRSLQFHIAAMEASKKEFEGRNSEEFIRLMRAMSGESAQAMEETRKRIIAIGDQWKTQAVAQITKAGAMPSTIIGNTPSTAPATRSLETDGPIRSTRRREWQDTTLRQTAYVRQIPLLQKEMTEGLLEQIQGSEIVRVQDRKYTAASGRVVKVFDLIDRDGRVLATAMKTLSGKLGLAAPRAAAEAVATGPQRGAVMTTYAVSAQDRIRQRVNERYNLETLNQAYAENAEFDKRREQERVASNMAKLDEQRTRTLTRRQVAQERLARIQQAEEEAAQRRIQQQAQLNSRIMTGVASAGLLASTMLMFVGNTQNAVVQVGLMAATFASMLPIVREMLPAVARAKLGGVASTALQGLSTLGGKIKSAVPIVSRAGSALAAAAFSPWTLAAAGAVLAIAFLVKKHKDAIEKMKADAVAYRDAISKTTSPNIAESNKDIIGLDDKVTKAADGWKNYSIRVGAAATATSDYVEKFKSQNADLIEGLKALNDTDLERRLSAIYKSLIISGASEAQAQVFLDSLGQILDKKSVTVNVVGKFKGWAKGRSDEELVLDNFNAADEALPDEIELSRQRSPNSRTSRPGRKNKAVDIYLEDEKDAAIPQFEAAGREYGQAIADGIQEGLITPENGKLKEYLDSLFNKISDSVIANTKTDDSLSRLLVGRPEDIQKAFDSVGVPISEGVKGLSRRFLELDKAGQEALLGTLRGLGPDGRAIAGALETIDRSTGAAIGTIGDADQALGSLIATAGQNGNITAYAAAMDVATEATAKTATAADVLNGMFKRAAEAARENFFALAKKNIDNYVDNVREKNQEMVENARETARAQVDAVRNAEREKIEALRKSQEKRQKQMEDRIERTRKEYDKEIDSIQKAEDVRRKAFEAEQERIRRLTEQRNFNIDYAQAVASGDLFGAARIRNEQDAAKKNYALEDQNANAEDAVEKRIKKIELERDKKIAAQEAALEAQKESDEASIESAQKASDARIAAAEKAADISVKAAEKAAERSNKAAQSAVEGQRKIMTEAQAAWDAAVARGEDGVAVAQEWGPKLGIPAKKARQIFETEYSNLKWTVAGGLKQAATDPEVLRQARLVGINTIAATLGLDLSEAERKFVSRPGVDLGFYFGERMSGKSFNEIKNAGVYAAAGGPETPYIPGRQVGGNVYKGMPYIVGETGHELFVPQQSGRIINNRDLKKMGREGGMGGMEGAMAAYGVGLSSIMAQAVGKTVASGIKRRGQQGFASGSYMGPVTQGNGIFDGGFSYPFGGRFRISSPFGWRNSPHGYGRMFHSGTDIAAPMGTPIKAIGGGIVQAVGWDPAKDPRGRPWLGMRTIINHGNGWQSYYGHQSEFLVKDGQRVSEGQRIGLVGSTGASTGPHLHLTIKNGGKLVNPSMVIPGLAKGAKINYDNTIANLHKGEAVLTAPITSKFEQLANRMSYNTGYGDIKVIFTGPVNSEVDVEAGVTAALNKRDLKMGKGRKID